MQSDIFRAVSKGKLSSVQYLIEKKGIDVNKKAEKDYGDGTIIIIYKGDTALHVACQNIHLQIVQYLIEKGSNIEAKDKNDETPLHIACFVGNLSVVQYLIEKGANENAKDEDGKTPLELFPPPKVTCVRRIHLSQKI